MRIMEKIFASILTIAIVLGDCGGMTAFAAENTVTAENTVSENDMPLDDAAENDAEIETDDNLTDSSAAPDASNETNLEIELPALHIGQIPNGEKLPTTEDAPFFYDLPLSFSSSESLILFVNYDMELTAEMKDHGTLEWSILRGEKGLTPGSAALLNAEDDWNGFETVPSSPCFTMEEVSDDKSEYYRMIMLTPKEADDETYDYYIRVAYYPETESGKAEDFYAAATLPFVPQNDAVTDEAQSSENPADTEEIVSVSENSSISENSSVSENNADIVDDERSGDTVEDDSPVTDENSGDENAEDPASENAETAQTTDILSVVSENSVMTASSSTPEEETAPSAPQKSEVKEITISETGPLTMQPTGDANTKLVTATVTAETASLALPPLLWESSDAAVATVTAGENGTATIKAVAEGYAKITASCGGKTASVTVDVVSDDSANKLLDLSNEIRVAGFEKENPSLIYTGQKITQNLRVYYKDKPLTEKTDYTLAYKNNVNAADWDSAKAPSVTINLKGQYQGSVTLYYTIYPLDINKIDIYTTDAAKTPAYEQTINYSKKVNIPAPVLYFGKKKLAAKRDFVCEYDTLTTELGGKDYKNGDSYQPGIIYHYTVKGTGNFTGTFPMDLVMLKDELKKKNFSTASVKLNKNKYEYRGTPLTKDDVKIETLKISNVTLAAELYDYEICANGIEGASLTVFPTAAGREAGYRGCKKINLKLAGDRKINDKDRIILSKNWQEEITFSQQTVDQTGGMFQQGTSLLNYQTEAGTEEPLVEGTDYTIKYGNAKKAGNVTVTFKGIGRYTGSVSKKYKILPNCNSQNLTIIWGGNVTKKADGSLEIPYQKNGAVPEFYIRDENYVVLNSKTDYSVTLKDNKKTTAESEKAMTCTIKGKGNYKGYEKVVTLTVTKADIGNALITVPDKPYDARPNKWKSTVTVIDTNGKKLAANTDYIREISYSYPGMDPANPTAVPSIGTTVTVTVTGTGNYEGTKSGTYRIYEKTKDIGKLKIVIDPKIYTGEEIRLEKKNIHVYASTADQKAKKELADKDSCFEILEDTYKNNCKVGTAKVTLHGIGTYGGTKTYSFKIQKKVYVKNSIKEISMAKDLSVSLLAKEANRTLTATLTPVDDTKIISNPTVIWTSSNSSIATAEISAVNKNETTNEVTVSALITAKKEGTVRITATTQDGNKRAVCTVKITLPTLKEKNQTIAGKAGDTHQLTVEEIDDPNQLANIESISFTSSNPNIASVNETGKITMHKIGPATIQFSINNGQYVQECYVVVTEGNVINPEEPRVLTYKQEEGCIDDAKEINKLLQKWEDEVTYQHQNNYDYLYIPAGEYHINPADPSFHAGIILRDGQSLIMSPEAKLYATGTTREDYKMIYAFNRKNIYISGGQLIGERNEHKGSGGEHGHGISINGCTNVHIRDVEVSKCWGDGIYLGFYDGPNISTNGVTITNCNLHHNRRNNLSITDASNVTVENCQFNDAKGTNPQFGIDIEPNKNRTCSNVRISNSTFKGNEKGTIQILGQLNAHVKGVTIENCKGNSAPVKWQGFGGSVSGVTDKNNNWNWNGN